MNKTNIKLLIQGKEKEVQFRTFPAGEEYVKLSESALSALGNLDCLEKAPVKIVFLSADSKTIMQGIMLSDAVKRAYGNECVAVMDYIPYGRQDRVCSDGESFSLDVIMKMLGGSFSSIETHDVHSEITLKKGPFYSMPVITEKLYSKSYLKIHKTQTSFSWINSSIFNIQEGVLVSPDKGANNRTMELSRVLSIDSILKLDKTRKDGRISVEVDSFRGEAGTTTIPKYIHQEILEFNNFIISDDICDGGGTFFAVMEAILAINPEARFTLIFSHGIFSQGLEKLLDYVEEIYVVDDYYNRNRLEMLELSENA